MINYGGEVMVSHRRLWVLARSGMPARFESGEEVGSLKMISCGLRSLAIAFYYLFKLLLLS